MTAFPVPDLADVLAAGRRIAPYLPVTPLYRYPALDAMTGAQVWVKHENHQPVGAFKVRGGVNLVEPAGAAALAAVLDAPRRFARPKVAIVCSGGNISPVRLAALWPYQMG